LLERDPELRVRVLARPFGPEDKLGPAPYDFQVNHPLIAPRADTLGFSHPQVGRAKIIHLGALRAAGSDSVEARIDTLVARYPQCAEFLPYYVTLANRAAAKLGMQALPDPVRHLRRELEEAGVLATRRELTALLNRRGLLGRAVEVGVATGVFSEHVLSHWRGTNLLSVDPWSAAPPDEYVDVSNRSQGEHEQAYERTKQRLARFGERSSVWRMTSAQAAARVPPASLDFAYIDGRHDYESVKEDLEAWYDKVRPGGIFAGHDYLDGVIPEGVFGVKSAVDEFFEAKRLPVKTTYVDTPWVSWYVEIPAG
jgi:methyltransferase family protein